MQNRPSGNRRRLEWASTTITHNAIASGTVTTDDLLSGFVTAGGSREGLTVMRIHLQLAYAAASAGGTSRIGLIVAGSGSTAATELNPASFPYEPWLLNRLLFPTTSGAVVDASTPFDIDNRSKRKVQHLGESLFLSWVATDTGTSSLVGLARVLVALP
jgi:hypothetical protein